MEFFFVKYSVSICNSALLVFLSIHLAYLVEKNGFLGLNMAGEKQTLVNVTLNFLELK